MAFEWKHKEKDVSHVDIWDVNTGGKGDNKHKDPEIEACLTCLGTPRRPVGWTKIGMRRAIEYEIIEILRGPYFVGSYYLRTWDFTLNKMRNHF